MQEIWGMQCTPSSFAGPLWPGEVAPDRVLSMGQIEHLTFKLHIYAFTKLLEIELLLHLTV